MGEKLFVRSYRAIVGTTEIKDLRVAFRVESSDKPEPNTMEIQTWNLSADTRGLLSGPGLTMQLEAGYIDNTELIMLGDIETVTHTRDGSDWITKVDAGDGSVALGRARISKSFAAGAKVKGILSELGGQMGVKIGSSLKKLSSGSFKGGWSELVNGVTMTGAVKDEMDKLTRSAGVDWYIQNGVLEVREEGAPKEDTAVLLRHDTGLIGSPEPGEKGILVAKSLIRPGLLPGRKLQIKSNAIDGFYLIRRTEYTGDTHTNEWYATMELKPL